MQHHPGRERRLLPLIALALVLLLFPEAAQVRGPGDRQECESGMSDEWLRVVFPSRYSSGSNPTRSPLEDNGEGLVAPRFVVSRDTATVAVSIIDEIDRVSLSEIDSRLLEEDPRRDDFHERAPRLFDGMIHFAGDHERAAEIVYVHGAAIAELAQFQRGVEEAGGLIPDRLPAADPLPARLSAVAGALSALLLFFPFVRRNVWLCGLFATSAMFLSLFSPYLLHHAGQSLTVRAVTVPGFEGNRSVELPDGQDPALFFALAASDSAAGRNRSGAYPDFADFLAHLAFQDAFRWNREFAVPEEGERIRGPSADGDGPVVHEFDSQWIAGFDFASWPFALLMSTFAGRAPVVEVTCEARATPPGTVAVPVSLVFLAAVFMVFSIALRQPGR